MTCHQFNVPVMFTIKSLLKLLLKSCFYEIVASFYKYFLVASIGGGDLKYNFRLSDSDQNFTSIIPYKDKKV